MSLLQLDYKLIGDAEALAGQYIHKANGLVHVYRGFFELQMEEQLLAAETALRQFVLARRLMLMM